MTRLQTRSNGPQRPWASPGPLPGPTKCLLLLQQQPVYHATPAASTFEARSVAIVTTGPLLNRGGVHGVQEVISIRLFELEVKSLSLAAGACRRFSVATVDLRHRITSVYFKLVANFRSFVFDDFLCSNLAPAQGKKHI